MSDLFLNPFLHERLPLLFVRTALPIVMVMGTNGLLTVVDALFLGHYVGESALAAVTMAFPFYMLLVALATLVASGMASQLARHLGAGRIDAAQHLFGSAHWLALSVATCAMGLYLIFESKLLSLAAGGNEMLIPLAASYLRVLFFTSPLFLILSVNSDALRCEGRAGFMALASLLVSLGNVAFDYLMIVRLELGVAGSAYATALAQALALGVVIWLRLSDHSTLHPRAVIRHVTTSGWNGMLALGAPQSLNFIGMALNSSAILLALQLARTPDYATTVTAYGVVTRVLTFAILPVIGLSQAMQTIIGHNHGAGAHRRARASLALALGLAAAYCATVQFSFMAFARPIGAAFVADPRVMTEIAAILPVIVSFYIMSGPMIMVAAHFQATGDAPRAALLGLAKPYLFGLPLTFVVPYFFGVQAIWWVTPVSEVLLVGLASLIIWRTIRRGTSVSPAKVQA